MKLSDSLPTLALVCLLAGAGPALRAAEPVASEAISFSIDRLPLDQQGPQVVDLNVRLDYNPGLGPKDYPDFEEIYRKIGAWMTTYPNKKDYWEVFERRLCQNVLKDYPMLARVTLELTVHPTYGVPYPQTIHTSLQR